MVLKIKRKTRNNYTTRKEEINNKLNLKIKNKKKIYKLTTKQCGNYSTVGNIEYVTERNSIKAKIIHISRNNGS